MKDILVKLYYFYEIKKSNDEMWDFEVRKML